jgi:ribosome-associated toxin RatA of RatAB toxin-antitoxin module
MLAITVSGLTVAQARAQQNDDSGGLADNRIVVTDLSKPSSAGKTFTASMVMNASVQKLCAIVLDYASYPRFMPNTAKTDVLRLDDNDALVDMTLALPLGKIKQYRLRMTSSTNRQACHLSWKLVPREDLTTDQTIADTSGYWRITPQPASPNRAVVEYFVYADPGPVPFGLGWIVDIMSRESLPRTLEAVRERALSQ